MTAKKKPAPPMTVEWWPVERPVPYARNARVCPDSAIAKVAGSIREFGWRQPIVVDGDGVIVAGHTRLLAAQRLGLDEVPVHVAADLSPAQVKAYRLADNRAAQETSWDDDMLAIEMEELSALDFDLDLTAFDEDELADLLAAEGEGGGGIVEDEAPEPPEDAITNPGDLWLLGEHRVLCGDALDDAATELLFAGAGADMVFTDPPYNVAYGESKNPKHKIREIEGDRQSDGDWLEFCEHLARMLRARCSADVYVWGTPGPDGMRQRLALIDGGAHWSATIVWKKQQLVLSPAKYQRMYEPCFYGWFGKSGFRADRKQVEVWEFDRPRSSDLHPTMKPIALCAYGIENSSNPGGVVFDPFLGSGSTLIAAEQTGRICYGLEIDPRYCDVIVARWERFTGREAVLGP